MIVGNIERDKLVRGVTKSASTKVESKLESQLSISAFKEGLEYKVFIVGKGLYSVVNYNGKLFYNKYSNST